MAELPGAAVKRLITKHGGELRISATALQLAVEAAEEYIGRLARAAAAAATAEKRKTIMDGDIRRGRETAG
jgi:histone H3/H4